MQAMCLNTAKTDAFPASYKCLRTRYNINKSYLQNETTLNKANHIHVAINEQYISLSKDPKLTVSLSGATISLSVRITSQANAGNGMPHIVTVVLSCKRARY